MLGRLPPERSPDPHREKPTAAPVVWNPQINQELAEQDGLTPEDFNWLDYPISNVRLTHPPEGSNSRWNLTYLAEMPTDTPQVNRYDADGQRLSDPRGSALSRVRFTLIDVTDGATLHQDLRDHIDGQVQGGITEAPDDLIWKRLLPGAFMQVQLEAIPLFFPYNNPDTGSGGIEYSNVNRGYLGGDVASSPVYLLELTLENELLIDGQSARSPAMLELDPDPGFAEWIVIAQEEIQGRHPSFTDEFLAGEAGISVDVLIQIKEGTFYVNQELRDRIDLILNTWIAK